MQSAWRFPYFVRAAHAPRVLLAAPRRNTAPSSSSSPCEARPGRRLRRGETNKDGPPLPNPPHEPIGRADLQVCTTCETMREECLGNSLHEPSIRSRPGKEAEGFVNTENPPPHLGGYKVHGPNACQNEMEAAPEPEGRHSGRPLFRRLESRRSRFRGAKRERSSGKSLFHPIEEREKSRSLMQPWGTASLPSLNTYSARRRRRHAMARVLPGKPGPGWPRSVSRFTFHAPRPCIS